MSSSVKMLAKKSTQKFAHFHDVLGLDLKKESLYFAPYEYFYKEALDCSRDDIWTDPVSLHIKYGWMNLKPNIMLDSVSQKIRNNKLDDAESYILQRHSKSSRYRTFGWIHARLQKKKN